MEYTVLIARSIEQIVLVMEYNQLLQIRVYMLTKLPMRLGD